MRQELIFPIETESEEMEMLISVKSPLEQASKRIVPVVVCGAVVAVAAVVVTALAVKKVTSK